MGGLLDFLRFPGFERFMLRTSSLSYTILYRTVVRNSNQNNICTDLNKVVSEHLQYCHSHILKTC